MGLGVTRGSGCLYAFMGLRVTASLFPSWETTRSLTQESACSPHVDGSRLTAIQRQHFVGHPDRPAMMGCGAIPERTSAPEHLTAVLSVRDIWNDERIVKV